MKYIIIAAVVAAIYFIVKAVQARRSSRDPNEPIALPDNTKLRKDLKLGYFGCMRDQPARTRESVNMFSDMFFDGVENAIKNIRYMAMTTHIGLDYFIWEKTTSGTYEPYSDAEDRVRALLTKFQTEDVLKYVELVSVVDEPDNKKIDDEAMTAAVAMVRRVLKEFDSSAKMYGVYGALFTWPGIDSLDVVGMDNYGPGTQIFKNGDYDRWLARLQPHQTTMLFPGVADPWRHSIQNWINHAHQDPRVYGIMMFVWFTNHAPDADYGKGTEENRLEGEIIEAGRRLLATNAVL